MMFVFAMLSNDFLAMYHYMLSIVCCVSEFASQITTVYDAPIHHVTDCDSEERCTEQGPTIATCPATGNPIHLVHLLWVQIFSV